MRACTFFDCSDGEEINNNLHAMRRNRYIRRNPPDNEVLIHHKPLQLDGHATEKGSDVR